MGGEKWRRRGRGAPEAHRKRMLGIIPASSAGRWRGGGADTGCRDCWSPSPPAHATPAAAISARSAAPGPRIVLEPVSLVRGHQIWVKPLTSAGGVVKRTTLKTWPFRTEDQFCSQTEFTPRKRGHKLQRLNANSFEPNRRIRGLALPCAALADRPARRLPSRGRSTAHRDQPQARRPGRSAPLRDAPDPLSRRSFSKLRRAATCPPRTLPSAGRW